MARKATFEDLVTQKGENPSGVTVITPNGVAHDGGDYPTNQQRNYMGGTDGPRWNSLAGAEPFTPMYPSRTTRRNRTGE